MSPTWWIVIILALAVGAGIVYYIYVRRPLQEKATPQDSYIQALRALLDGNHTLAFLKLKESVTYDSNNVDAYIRLAALLRQKGMKSKSLQLSIDLNMRETISPVDKVRVLYNLSEAYIASGDLDSAEGILKQLTRMSGQKATASKLLLGLYEKMGRWEDAYKVGLDYLSAANISDRSSLAKYRIKIGQKLVEEKEFHKARLEFKEALKLDRLCVEAVVMIGDAYEKESRLEDAVKSWRQILEISPRRSELVFARLRKALFDLGQFGEIEALYNKVLEKDKDNLAALTGLATLAEKKGDLTQAEETYLQILDSKPDYRPALAGLLKLYREENKFGEAAQVINRTVETLNPAE